MATMPRLDNALDFHDAKITSYVALTKTWMPKFTSASLYIVLLFKHDCNLCGDSRLSCASLDQGTESS